MDLEHERRLADVENRAASNTKRLDRLEENASVLNRLATDRWTEIPESEVPEPDIPDNK